VEKVLCTFENASCPTAMRVVYGVYVVAGPTPTPTERPEEGLARTFPYISILSLKNLKHRKHCKQCPFYKAQSCLRFPSGPTTPCTHPRPYPGYPDNHGCHSPVLAGLFPPECSLPSRASAPGAHCTNRHGRYQSAPGATTAHVRGMYCGRRDAPVVGRHRLDTLALHSDAFKNSNSYIGCRRMIIVSQYQ